MFNSEIVLDALDWLEDCFEECPADLSVNEIVKAIQRHWSGGWENFVETWQQDHA
jgi:hypothetical protein|tara:strand:+ start:13713 stop:13877 length:165 start_codon:yes stop_codon:yes gene_type:complete